MTASTHNYSRYPGVLPAVCLAFSAYSPGARAETPGATTLDPSFHWLSQGNTLDAYAFTGAGPAYAVCCYTVKDLGGRAWDRLV